MPQNQGVSTPPKQSKAERQAAQRAAVLAENKRREQAAKRGRLAAIVLSIVGVLAVVAVIVVVIVVNIKPPADEIEIEGLETFENLEQTHVEGTVEYAMTPPAGGPHFQAWLNCGVYTEPQPNEIAVHALEHGAVWITYRPDLPEADVQTLEATLPSTYGVLSPYPGLDTPVAISAWGAQLKVTDADDPRLQDFIDKYWRSADSPEPNAPCTGAIDGPGKK